MVMMQGNRIHILLNFYYVHFDFNAANVKLFFGIAKHLSEKIMKKQKFDDYPLLNSNPPTISNRPI